ncbi:metal-dependent hydrolase [Methanobrevibacter wolinii]|uniref:metal-dependent hydrolase n=1 Tax=Methanobrevibacter wolinii TaxID=190977 RepID=UPI0005B2A5F3|nr:metal-dependent hydrolase [Methanobrevibacter wolinii]MDD5959393.1 metal-dependent hydrolase [Methanobrevibacter wolinii]
MEIKWLGHSAFEIITSDTTILIDPFISNNPVCSTPVEELNPDIICLTHGHSDHFGDLLELAEVNNPVVVTNAELAVFLQKQGIEAVSMNIGGSISVRDIRITMLDAKHSSDIDFVEENCIPGGSAASFLFTFEDGTKIYHAGDTGLYSDMENIIGRIYKPDVLMVPIGDKFTMGPFEGALATHWMSPKVVIPMHYNTFPAIEQDPVVFSNFVKQLNPSIDVVIMNPGETYEVPDFNDED